MHCDFSDSVKLTHDPEKLQTFRTRSCVKAKLYRALAIQVESIAIEPPRRNARTRSATWSGNSSCTASLPAGTSAAPTLGNAASAFISSLDRAGVSAP